MRKLILTLCIIVNSLYIYAQELTWLKIDKGLWATSYLSPKPSLFGNSKLTILKIDPKLFKFDLYHDDYGYTADQWAGELELSIVVNAGMYDHKGTNMGAMKSYDQVFNPNFNRDNAFFVFNPKSEGLPFADIIDAKHSSSQGKLGMYHSYTQSIRMVTMDGKNTWAQRERMWSVIVGAVDKDGYILLIHCRSPYTMHDFINIVLESPLRVRNMIYLEGGPEASLFINHNGFHTGRVGSYETGFYDDSNHRYWRIHNIIGIKKRTNE